MGEVMYGPIVRSAIRMFHVKTSRDTAVELDTQVKAKSNGAKF
jgi:hypothetical protein